MTANPLLGSPSKSTRSALWSKTSTYTYEPLQGPKYIRVLDLLPGAFKEPLVAELLQQNLDLDNKNYEAISYVWGEPSEVASINIRYAKDQRGSLLDEYVAGSIAITPNAEAALRHLRYEDRPRTLWIDSICINQKDIIEQGAQVAFMADVYGSAQRVLVWLGTASDDSDHAMQLMAFMGSQVNFDNSVPKHFTPAPHDGVDPSWSNTDVKSPWSEDDVRALESLFNRPYFERLWVRQEVRACSDDSLVICGRESISWPHFSKAGILVPRKCLAAIRVEENTYPFNFLLRSELVESMCFGSNGFKPMAIYLNDLRKCECLDDRDRVYAILAFEDRLRTAIVPDYSKSASQVFQEATRKLLLSGDTLDMLCHTGLSIVGTDCPSWASDWRFHELTISIDPFPMCRASGPTTYELHDYDETSNVLSIAGIGLSEVLRVWPSVFPDVATTSFFFDGLYTLDQLQVELVKPGADVVRGERSDDLFKALCRTICIGNFGDVYQEGSDEARGTPSFAACYASMPSTEWPSPGGDQPLRFKKHECAGFTTATGFCLARALFITEDGLLRLGPQDMKANDKVVVFLGANTPFLLRETTSGSQYQLVGECYYDQHMYGEALFGLLPSPWTPMACFAEIPYRGYRNLELQQDFRIDPRLQILVNKKCLKDEAMDIPRPSKNYSLDCLRGLGIAQNIEYFDLV